MHKYTLRLVVDEESKTADKPPQPKNVLSVDFPETTFIAVTAYQNEEVWEDNAARLHDDSHAHEHTGHTAQDIKQPVRKGFQRNVCRHVSYIFTGIVCPFLSHSL